MGDGGPVPQRRDEAIEGLELFDECASAAPVARGRSKRGALLDALLDPDAERAAERLRGIVAEGADHFVDALLPEVAWRLGEMWLQDRVGFADVTIAAARLQSALREVDPGPDLASGPLVAVVVPQGETHTLGAAVAAWRLRRAGASVMLVMNRPVAAIEDRIGGGQMGAICLSVSASGDPEALAPLVRRLRKASGAPVLLGGAILAEWGREALLRISGADVVSWEPEDALRAATGPRS